MQVMQGKGGSLPAKSFRLLLEIHAVAGDAKSSIDILDYIIGANTDKQKKPKSKEVSTTFRLDHSIFDKLFQACVVKSSSSSRHNRGTIADGILQRMIHLSDLGLLSSSGGPNNGHYTQVMDAWAKSGHAQAAKRTMEIWNYLRHAAYREKKWWLKPDSTNLLTVLHSLARAGQAEEAERLLWNVCNDDTDIQPDVINFNAVLDAWAKTKTIHAGERAEQILRSMMKDNSNYKVEPDVISFTSVIHAWSTSGNPDAGVRAQQVFDELCKLAQSNAKMAPNHTTYNSLISAWAKVGDVHKAAEVLATLMSAKLDAANVEMHMIAFSSVLDAYARAKDPRGAERLLRNMEQSGITPNTVCYNSVINAWAKEGSPVAGQEAERILQDMQDNTSVTPNVRTFNSVIHAYARSRNGGESAERLLRVLQEMARHHPDRRLKPDAITFNSAMNAFAKEGNPQQAENLLEEMKQEGGNISPSVVSYNACLEAWSRSGHPDSGEKADQYLELMKPFRESGPTLAVRYKLAIMCWQNSARANHPIAAQRIEDLSQTLQEIQGRKGENSL
eukprot:Sro565_g167580.2  (559) ;mRNA; r:19740-21416